jgi:hypothetical protein
MTSHLIRSESSIVLVEITLQMQNPRKGRIFGADEECPTLCVILACINKLHYWKCVKSYTCFGNEFKVITIVTNQFEAKTRSLETKWKIMKHMMFINSWVVLGCVATLNE